MAGYNGGKQLGRDAVLREVGPLVSQATLEHEQHPRICPGEDGTRGLGVTASMVDDERITFPLLSQVVVRSSSATAPELGHVNLP